MQPQLHCVEVEHAVTLDHDLAVERRVGRKQLSDLEELRKVTKQWPRVPAPDRELAFQVLHHPAKAVPLRLVLPVALRQLGDELGLHRREGKVSGRHVVGRLVPWVSSTACGRSSAPAAPCRRWSAFARRSRVYPGRPSSARCPVRGSTSWARPCTTGCRSPASSICSSRTSRGIAGSRRFGVTSSARSNSGESEQEERCLRTNSKSNSSSTSTRPMRWSKTFCECSTE